MKTKKMILRNMERAYTTSFFEIGGINYIFFASESTPGIPGEAYAYPIHDLNHPECIWNDAGGCMSIIKDPLDCDSLFAIQNFYLKENPSNAKIVRIKRYKKNVWKVIDSFYLPLVHRIGILTEKDQYYMIACTVAKSKENKDDWSQAGEVWFSKLDKENFSFDFKRIYSGMYKNHGFYQFIEKGKDYICIGTDNGAYTLSVKNSQLKINKILEGKIGEIALEDINDDGKLELISIEPFHGNQIKIYQKNNIDKYHVVWKYQDNVEFAHALSGSIILSKKSFIVGVRKGNGALFTITFDKRKYSVNKIDEHGGPANLCAFHHNQKDYIACANHTSNQCVLYEIIRE
ncbi:hypothetical protein [Faecalicoccus pleomorphus]|uniref:hypothetical protein n=1 Tax=Faecalicoccus pleomorphus TaxID=1323 RepID=UPI0022E3145C|nr:hypothetical protein [Faecalicoccus pleomorphus]